MAEVEGAMQTPDGRWLVQLVRGRKTRWYRIVHGDDVFDRLSIATVERVLDEAGVDRSLLAEVPRSAPEPAPAELILPESSTRAARVR
ncbi:hypothetical protein [Actinoplanes sp. NPDC051859]|uniref:hypothetical protein n=1 Tax=Actinoplanes sp. NPDC051859 TaxID=3363909 RepID=UPI00378F7834